jgi:hypothetical protein
MLLDVGESSSSKSNLNSLKKILSTLSLMLRETDVTGWYKEDSVVGVMFTEITLDRGSMPATMMTRVSQTLKRHLTPQQFQEIGIAFHLLAEPPDFPPRDSYPGVYPGVAAESPLVDGNR